MSKSSAETDVEKTSASLIVRAQAGDRNAWRQVSSIYGPMVYRWTRRAGLQAVDAEDIGQEVFRAVARSIVDFQHGKSGNTFRGWLWTITRNKIRDHFRAGANAPDATGGSAAHQILQQIPERLSADSAADELNRVSHRLLEELQSEFEPTTWQAFWRAAVEGDAATDIADDLSVSKWAVYKCKSRVLSRLREMLRDLGEVD